MLRSETTLKPGFYRLPEDPVAEDILIPGFRSATSVSGAFGWFSKGWIERLAPGLAIYLNRLDTQPVNFIVAPVFFPEEKTAVERGQQITSDQAAELVCDVFVNERSDASALAKHALACLAWMIAKEKLRLRIAVPTGESNYHPKIWLFNDKIHQVLVRGSGNATDRGIAKGVEHYDVDVSWHPESQARVNKGISILDAWSHGRSQGIKEVIDLPEALHRKIIQTAPNSPPQPSHFVSVYRSSQLPVYAHDRTRSKLRIPLDISWTDGPYSHQAEAVKSWEDADPPETGVIAMATGAGKTLTALICASRCQDRLNEKPFLVVVSAPSIPLIIQWQNEIKRFFVNPIVPNQEGGPEKSLTRLFRGLQGGGTHIVVVTNNMLCDTRFQSTISNKLSQNKFITMLIADEAHTLGANSFINNKPHFFEKRLGLSATPERQYDPDGTEEIFKFFGPTVYEFGLDRAINFCLVPYSYYVHASALDGAELEEFEQLTRKIGAAIRTEDNDEESNLQSLLIRRRRIIETAESKINLLRKVLLRRGVRDLRHVLIYASSKNPTQFQKIAKILTELEVKWAPVTQETTRNPEKLQRIFDSFSNGGIQVLLAKKVLDEGVDIPSIREAFIVASSTVEREWIQRRGRVLRTHPSKPWAIIHDFLALPPSDHNLPDSIKKTVTSELKRAYTFGAHAQNCTGVQGVHADLQKLSNAYWPKDGLKSNILSTLNSQFIASAIPKGKPW